LYFEIRIWSAPFALANFALLGWIVGLGRTKIGVALHMGMTALNILLCLIFSFYGSWGVAGVAWAGVSSEIAGALAGLIIAAVWFKRLDVTWAQISDRSKLLRMVALNRDIMLRTIRLLLAWAFFARQGAKMGDVTLAANAVLLNLFALGGYFLD